MRSRVLLLAVLAFTALAIWWRLEWGAAGVEIGPRSASRLANDDAVVGPGSTVAPRKEVLSEPLAASGADGFRVLTVDEDGAALKAVEVWEIVGDRPVPIGRTDEGGSLRLPVEHRPERLAARKLGWQPSEVRLPSELPSTCTIALRRAGRLRGQVLRRGVPAAGACVVAWPAGVSLVPSSYFERALSGDPRALSVITDGEGYFEIVGIDPASTYRVLAGTSGWLMTAATEARADGELQLELAGLYAVLVRLVDDVGQRVHVSSSLLLPSYALALRGVETYRGPKAGLVLAGIPSELTRYEDTPELFFWGLGDGVAPCVGRVVAGGIEVPGYEPATIETDLCRTDEGLEIVEAVLTSRGIPTGALRIELAGLGALAGLDTSSDASGMTGKVVLNGGLDEDWVEIRLAALTGSLVVEGLPCGTYSASFAGPSGLFFVPGPAGPPNVVKITEEGGVVSFDLSAACGVEFAIHDELGQYHGPLSAVLTSGGSGFGPAHFVDFTRSPYRILGLAEGEYALRLRHPANASELATWRAVPGRIETVEIALSR